MTSLRALPPIGATALALALTGRGTRRSSTSAPVQTSPASAVAPTTATQEP